MKSALLSLVLLIPASALAAPTEPDCTVITSTEAHIPDGPAQNIAIVLADGRIRALGAAIVGLGTPADGGIEWGGRHCTWIDGTGQVITAGFIDTHSSVGLVEVSMEAGTRNSDAGGSEPVRAHVRITDGYNPLSSLVPIARREGITTSVLMPRGGSFSGAAGAVDLAGLTQAEAVIDELVALPAHLNQGSSFSSRLGHLRATLSEARVYAKSPSTWASRAGLRPDAPDADALAALQPVLKGDLPLVVSADAAWQLEALARFATEERIRLVIEGAAEGWLVADLLADADIAVAVRPMTYGPGAFSQLHARPDNAALLADAGVPVLIGSFSAHFARILRQLAGNAVRGGMDHAEALAAITSVPADVFGLTGRGRLRVGDVANVVLWSGDPLEISSDVLGVWIQGRRRTLETRQTRLFERYRDLPGSPTTGLPLE